MHDYKRTFWDCHYKSAQMLNDAKIKALVLVSTVVSGVKEMILWFAFLQIMLYKFLFLFCVDLAIVKKSEYAVLYIIFLHVNNTIYT